MNSTIWLTPTIGGTSRPFLENAVTAVWSPDGTRIAYHENTPGDPIFIAWKRNGSNPKQIFIEKPGLHCHYPAWSRDSRFVYFVRGFAPNEMDIWRISSAGGGPQRITHHNSRRPILTLLDDRTLISYSPAEDGSGVWLYATDVERRIPHRVSFGVEHYLSVSASSNGRRLAATVANPSGNLWTVPILEGIAEESAARRFALLRTCALSSHGSVPTIFCISHPEVVPTESGNSGGTSLPNYGKRVRARFRTPCRHLARWPPDLFFC